MYDVVGYRTYTILTGSMMPKINPGDVVVVKNIKRADIKEEDVITFMYDNEVVTHRIKEVTKEGYITKGDNNNTEDVGVQSHESVIGKVQMTIPKLGYAVQFLANPMVVAAELILLGIFIIIYNRD